MGRAWVIGPKVTIDAGRTAIDKFLVDVARQPHAGSFGPTRAVLVGVIFLSEAPPEVSQESTLSKGAQRWMLAS